jgi:hypothetical protein
MPYIASPWRPKTTAEKYHIERSTAKKNEKESRLKKIRTTVEPALHHRPVLSIGCHHPVESAQPAGVNRVGGEEGEGGHKAQLFFGRCVREKSQFKPKSTFLLAFATITVER